MPSTVLYIPKSKLPTVAALSEITFNEFHSSEILLFLLKNVLIDSKIAFDDFDLKVDWPNIINGFSAFLIKFEISCLSNAIS